MSPRETHYIPAFTIFRGKPSFSQRAVCGVYIRPDGHRNDPMCPICQRWLTQSAEADKTTAAGLGLVEVDGILLTEEEAARR